MKRCGGLLGILAVLVLCWCGLGAASASASWTEECADILPGLPTNGTFYKEKQCTTKDNLNGKFHWLITEQRNWFFTRWLVGSTQDISGTVGGVKFTVSCEAVTSSGEAENFEEEGEELFIGKEMVVEYTKCTVTAPAGKGCKVAEPIKTTKLKSAVVSEPEEQSRIKLEPESGTNFATITVSGCSISGLNGEKTIEGTITGVVPSSELWMLEFTSTSGSALKMAGQTLTYAGKVSSENAETGYTLRII
jgi:hypothetical protein